MNNNTFSKYFAKPQKKPTTNNNIFASYQEEARKREEEEILNSMLLKKEIEDMKKEKELEEKEGYTSLSAEEVMTGISHSKQTNLAKSNVIGKVAKEKHDEFMYYVDKMAIANGEQSLWERRKELSKKFHAKNEPDTTPNAVSRIETVSGVDDTVNKQFNLDESLPNAEKYNKLYTINPQERMNFLYTTFMKAVKIADMNTYNSKEEREQAIKFTADKLLEDFNATN